MPAVAATIVPFALVFRIEDGSWKSVVEPVFETEKRVALTPAEVVLEIAKSVVVAVVEAA